MGRGRNKKAKNGRDAAGADGGDEACGIASRTRSGGRRPPPSRVPDETLDFNPRCAAKKRDAEGKLVESTMCHQCQRNDKGRVVRCTRCNAKRYCIKCIEAWSRMSAIDK